MAVTRLRVNSVSKLSITGIELPQDAQLPKELLQSVLGTLSDTEEKYGDWMIS
jgi:hypothetical protein